MNALAKLTPVPIAQDGYEVVTADGVWIKQYVFGHPGMRVPQHAHVWDHTTLLARGSVLLWKDGVFDRRYDAPSAIFIASGVKHMFETIGPDTLMYCVHNACHPGVAAVLAEHELEF